MVDSGPDREPATPFEYTQIVQDQLSSAGFDPHVLQPFDIIEDVVDATDIPALDRDHEDWPDTIDFDSTRKQHLMHKLDLEELDGIDLVDPREENVLKLRYVDVEVQNVYCHYIDHKVRKDRRSFGSSRERAIKREFDRNKTALEKLAKRFDRKLAQAGRRGDYHLLDATDPDSEAFELLEETCGRHPATLGRFWGDLYDFFTFAAESEFGGGTNPLVIIEDESDMPPDAAFELGGVGQVFQEAPRLRDAVGALASVALGTPLILWSMGRVGPWWPGMPADSWLTAAVLFLGCVPIVLRCVDRPTNDGSSLPG